jgi:hypothetical protein
MYTLAGASPATLEGTRARGDGNRRHLRRLDLCLKLLEDAHEQDEVMVPSDIADRVRLCVPSVEPGMLIAEAIDLVLSEQQPLLMHSTGDVHNGCRRITGAAELGRVRHSVADCSVVSHAHSAHRDECDGGPPATSRGGSPAAARGRGHEEVTSELNQQGAAACDDVTARPGGVHMTFQPTVSGADACPPIAPLDEAEARALSDRIRAAAGRLCSLLLEAHERRAWSALGYSTWEQYVRTEFDLSRSRSYELLDQARVIRAIEAVTGLNGVPDISPFAAGQIKPYLMEVTEKVRARTADVPRHRVARVAARAVREERSRIAAWRECGLTRSNGHTAMAAHADAASYAPAPIATDVRRVAPIADRARFPDPPRVGVDAVELERLYEAIIVLAHMPRVEDVIGSVPPLGHEFVTEVRRALRWLSELERQWELEGRLFTSQGRQGTGDVDPSGSAAVSVTGGAST